MYLVKISAISVRVGGGEANINIILNNTCIGDRCVLHVYSHVSEHNFDKTAENDHKIKYIPRISKIVLWNQIIIIISDIFL